jgi:hypothetical protein
MVTNLGGAIPVPNLPVGARYGLLDNLDLSGHLNILPLITGGFTALDASLTWGIIRHQGRRGFDLATGAGLVLMTDFDTAARISPLVDMALGYAVNRFHPFIGFEAVIDARASGVIVDPYVGLEVDIGSWSISGEVLWFHPAHNWYSSAIRYVSINDTQGAVGVILGLKRRFDLTGGLKR